MSTNEHVKVLEELRATAARFNVHAHVAALDAAIAALKAFDAEPDVDLELIWNDVSDNAETNAAYRRLKARLAALNPWQPIETAPKDGTRILTCVLGSDGRAYDYQINDWNDPRAVADGNGIGSVGWWRSRPSRQPTHWHPLTTPPAQESANG